VQLLDPRPQRLGQPAPGPSPVPRPMLQKPAVFGTQAQLDKKGLLGSGAAGAIRRDPAAHRPAARAARAGDVTRQNGAVAEAKGRLTS
jgi:hypothetical protein